MSVIRFLSGASSDSSLQLHKNQLKRLPESFSDLIFLTYVDLSYVGASFGMLVNVVIQRERT